MPRIDHFDEWHLLRSEASEHFGFDFVSGFSETPIVVVSSLLQARLNSVGSISDAMHDNGIEDLGEELFADATANLALRVKTFSI